MTDRRWKVSRHFIVERWRISTRLRVYHGLGHAKFEFVPLLGLEGVVTGLRNSGNPPVTEQRGPCRG